MLAEISRGICLHCVHTLLETITPNKVNKSHSVYIPRDIVFLKYGRNWSRMFCLNMLNACGIFFYIFPAKFTESRSTPKITLKMCYDQGKSYSKYESHPGLEFNTVPVTVEIYLRTMEIHCLDVIGMS